MSSVLLAWLQANQISLLMVEVPESHHKKPCRCPCLKRSDASLATNAACLLALASNSPGYLAVARANWVLFFTEASVSSPVPVFRILVKESAVKLVLPCVHLHSLDLPGSPQRVRTIHGKIIIKFWRHPPQQLGYSRENQG